MREGPAALILGEPAARFVAGRLGYAEVWDRCRAFGVVRDGAIVGGIVFHDWNPDRGTIEFSCAGRDWLTRRTLRAFGDYAFKVARLVVARTSERNAVVRRVWKRLGGRETLVPDLWGPGEAGAILTLTEEAFRGRTQGTDPA